MPNKQAFTFVELLTLTAITTTTAVLLSPLLTQGDERENRARCIANGSQVAKALYSYTIEWEGKYPLAMRPNGTTGWLLFHPANWSPSDTLAWEFPHHWRSEQTMTRWNENATGWINSSNRYIQNINIHHCPAGREVFRPVGEEYNNPRTQPGFVSYTMNGNLHRFSDSGIVDAGEFPVLWESHGKARILGFAISNPVLNCESTPQCVYGVPDLPFPANIMYGTSSALSNPGGPLWVHEQGMIFFNSQGSAKWKKVGAVIANQGNGCEARGGNFSPPTNPSQDPFTGYWEDGCAGYYWVDASGYALLFRPDYDYLDEPDPTNTLRIRLR